MSNTNLTYLQPFEKILKLGVDQMLHLSTGAVSSHFNVQTQEKKSPKYLFFLKKGAIKIITFDAFEGKHIKFLVKQGQFFGELALANVDMPDYHAIALEDSSIGYFELDSVREQMNRNADFNLHMLLLISNRINLLENRINQLAHKDSKTRVIEFLHSFIQEFGSKDQNQWSVRNFLKNKEIAQLTFTSRQTVNAVMNQLKKSKQIDFDADYIFVKNQSLQLSV